MLTYRIIFILFLLPGFAFADNGDSTRTKKVKIFPLPAFGYAPETRWYVGAVGLFSISHQTDSANSPSVFEPEINYTQNKQWIVTLDHEWRFRNDRIRWVGENGYFDYPEDFYGEGYDWAQGPEIKIDAKRIELDNSFLIRAVPNFYYGIRFRYHNMKVAYASDSSYYNFFGDRNEAVGIGPLAIYDTRDNPLNATKGVRAYLSLMGFDNTAPGENNFVRADIDFRWYQSLINNQVLAIHFQTSHTAGDVPIRLLPLAGNENMLRGYYEGRYRDSHFTAIQAEYRLKIWNWIGAVAFAGCGSIYDDDHTFKDLPLLPNYGAGLRIRLDKKDNINLRFDYGMGKNVEGFYVSFGEAF